MRVLALDAGNTAFKMAVFTDGKIGGIYRGEEFNESILHTFLADEPADAAIWCSVRNDTEAIRNTLQRFMPERQLSSKMATPVKNEYKTPETLGADRLAAVNGARYVFPGDDVFVIGVGTTITYDLIQSDGTYRGGSISPGVRMRFDALHRLTAKLPQVSMHNTFQESYGSDTRTAILSGVQNGIVHEIKGFITEVAARFKAVKTVLTGGDASFFEGLLKKGIFAPPVIHEPNLVLIGLHAVYEYNDQTL